MAYDIPSISDLEAIQLLNKHYAEVVTSKKDGIASGLDITQTTNPITGVTRRTLYKILDDMDDMFLERLLKMSFTPVGTFTAGATLTDARQTLLWEVSEGGDGRYYSWSGSFGTFGKTVAAGSTPSEPEWVDRTDDSLRDEIRETVFQNMKRNYAEAGFNLVDGSFQLGATLSGWPDVLWDWTSGKGYQWHLDEAKTVVAGSSPTNIGTDWIDKSNFTLNGGGELDSIVDAQKTKYLVGTEFKVKGTTFKISDTAPISAQVPLIQDGNNNYLIPISNVIDSAFNNNDITTAESFTYTYSGITIGHQAMVVDTRAGTIIVSIANYDTTPHSFKLIEYDFTGGVIGSLIAETGWINYGHGDYFAIVYDGVDRYVWFHSPTLTTYGAGVLARIQVTNGVTTPDITVNYPAAFSSLFFRVTDTLNNKIRLFTDVGAWDIEPLTLTDGETLTFTTDTKLNYVQLANSGRLPNQALRQYGNEALSLFGGTTFNYGSCGLNYTSEDYTNNRVIPFDINVMPNAETSSEPQGIALLWDSNKCKFEVLASFAYNVTGDGIAYILNLSAGDDAASSIAVTPYTFAQRKASGLATVQSDTDSIYAASSSPIFAPAVLIGTNNSIATDEEEAVDTFYLTQVYGLSSGTGRRQANVKYRDSAELIFDHYTDSSFPAGFRFAIGGGDSGITSNVPLQIRDQVTTFGTPRASSYVDTFYPTAEFVGSNSNALRPAGSNEGIVGQVFNCTLDIAAKSGTVIQVGDYNVTTGAYNIWYNLNSANFHAGTDNVRSLGTSSIRWSVVYAATGTINTSDEDLKAFCDEELSDAVLDVWSTINWRAFKFNDAIEQKGIDNARVHFGLGAQTVKKAFEDAGLDGFKYGLLCYDEWVETPELKNDSGVVVQEYQPAGSRYGIRYEEALVLEAALMRRTTKRLTEKLSALESK